MNYEAIREALFTLARLTREQEDLFIENEGEVTPETEALEEEKTAIAELLNGEGLDDLGRWLKSKEDELKAVKAEKDAASRRIKSVENTIDFVKSVIRTVMDATGCEKARGAFYGFATSQSCTTSVDKDALKEEWQGTVEAAVRAAGVPDWVTVTLGASVSKVPEGADLPDCFTTATKDTVRFIKPRKTND